LEIKGVVEELRAAESGPGDAEQAAEEPEYTTVKKY